MNPGGPVSAHDVRRYRTGCGFRISPEKGAVGITEALELQPSLSDGDLARAASDGDRQAFAEIYDRYADRLYDFCVGLIGDRDAAADCVQDAFCVAATDLPGLREPDKLRPWLYSIARHHAMRRLRHRYREEVSEEVPDMVSTEASPETLAGQSELARLVAEAAGGLSDRDRELLDLSYRHGLDGPEIAEALGVTLTSANTMMFRLRQTVERCLGALLVARGARANPDACPELAAILKGWDGQFTVLMRKRMARHIDSCEICEQDQREQVNPVALLGSAAVFIPAPAALRRQTLDRVQLTSASSSLAEPARPSSSSGVTETPGASAGSQQGRKRRFTLIVGIPLVCLGLLVSWFARSEGPVARIVDTGSDSRPLSVAPAAVKGAPTTARQQPVPAAGTGQPAVPIRQAQTTSGTVAPVQTSAANGPGTGPDVMLPNAGIVAPAPVQIGPATVPDSDAQATDPGPQVDIAPVDTPTVTGPTDPAPQSPGNLGLSPNLSPNLNLNPNVISQVPQPAITANIDTLPKPTNGTTTSGTNTTNTTNGTNTTSGSGKTAGGSSGTTSGSGTNTTSGGSTNTTTGGGKTTGGSSGTTSGSGTNTTSGGSSSGSNTKSTNSTSK